MHPLESALKEFAATRQPLFARATNEIKSFTKKSAPHPSGICLVHPKQSFPRGTVFPLLLLAHRVLAATPATLLLRTAEPSVAFGDGELADFR